MSREPRRRLFWLALSLATVGVVAAWLLWPRGEAKHGGTGKGGPRTARAPAKRSTDPPNPGARRRLASDPRPDAPQGETTYSDEVMRLHRDRWEYFGRDDPPPPTPGSPEAKAIPKPERVERESRDASTEFKRKMASRMLAHQKERLARVRDRIVRARASGDARALRINKGIEQRLLSRVDELTKELDRLSSDEIGDSPRGSPHDHDGHRNSPGGSSYGDESASDSSGTSDERTPGARPPAGSP